MDMMGQLSLELVSFSSSISLSQGSREVSMVRGRGSLVRARMARTDLVSLVSLPSGHQDQLTVDMDRSSMVRASMGLVRLALVRSTTWGQCSLGQASLPHGRWERVSMAREWGILVQGSVHLLWLGLLSLCLGGLERG